MEKLAVEIMAISLEFVYKFSVTPKWREIHSVKVLRLSFKNSYKAPLNASEFYSF